MTRFLVVLILLLPIEALSKARVAGQGRTTKSVQTQKAKKSLKRSSRAPVAASFDQALQFEAQTAAPKKRGLATQAGTGLNGGAGGSASDLNLAQVAPPGATVPVVVPVAGNPAVPVAGAQPGVQLPGPLNPGLLPVNPVPVAGVTPVLDANQLAAIQQQQLAAAQEGCAQWYNATPFCQQLRAQQQPQWSPYRGYNTPNNYMLPGAQAQNSGSGGGGGGGMPNLGSLFGGGNKNQQPQSANTSAPSYSGGGNGMGSQSSETTGSVKASSPDGLCSDPKISATKKDWCKVIQTQLTGPNDCTRPLFDRFVQRAASEQVKGMELFCPKFKSINMDPSKSAKFLENLVSALIQEESSWNPQKQGDGGKSLGLLQVSRSDANGAYRCACGGVANDIFDPAANLRCGTHILMYNLVNTKSGQMDLGSGSVRAENADGIARYFGPFNSHQDDKKRLMAGRVKAWCEAEINGSNRLPADAPDAAPAAVQ